MYIIPFGEQPDWNDTDSGLSESPYLPNRKGDFFMRIIKKEVKNQKIIRGFFKIKRTATGFCGIAYMTISAMPMTAFAASGTSAVTQPLDNLKTLVIAVIGAVGVIIVAKNVMEFAQAYQQQDSSTMNSALKGIVAGVMMAGISTVLTFLGF